MSLRKNQFKIPILLLTWKREKEIKLILNILKKINASNIYVNSDGFNYKSSKIYYHPLDLAMSMQ